MARQKKKVVPLADRIPPDQQKLAARFFTISNMGQPEPRRLDEIDQKYAELEGDLYGELEANGEREEEPLRAEFECWLKDVRAGDEYVTTEWNKKIYPTLIKPGMWECKVEK